MKIYTRTDDKGQTGIIGGRVNKDDLRVEAYGTVDELNGFVALAHAELDKGLNQDIANDLIKIQHELFDLGGDLASVVEKRPDKMDSEMITYLEEQIDRYTEEAPDLEKFILRSEEHTSELQSRGHLVCRLLLEKKKKKQI